MTKLILFALSMLLAVSSAFAQKHPEYEWGKNTGGWDVATDNNGSLYTIGSFVDTITRNGYTYISKGSSDVILSKLDMNGNIIWEKPIGGLGTDHPGSVCCDGSGNVFVSGEFDGIIVIGDDTLQKKGSNGIFLVKLDNTGNIIWAKSIEYACNHPFNNIAADNADNLYITITFCKSGLDTLQLGPDKFVTAGMDILIIKFMPSGDIAWARQIGNLTSAEGGLGITTDNNGNVYFTGYIADTTLVNANKLFIGKYDSSGTLQFLSSPAYGGYGRGMDVNVTNNGNIYVCGHLNDTTILGLDTINVNTWTAILIKYDASGNVQWARQYEGNNTIESISIDVHEEDVFIATYSESYLVKYDGTGNIKWTNENGPHSKPPFLVGLCTDKHGNLYFTGSCTNRNNTFGKDTIQVPQDNSEQIFIAKAGPFPSGISTQITTSHDITLYPNPNSGTYTVHGKSLKNYTSYSIVSVTGQSVAKGHVSTGGGTCQIDAGDLAKGIYILRLNGSQGISSLTFAVE